MKISNIIALAAITFMLSSFPDQTHAKDTIELAEEDTTPTVSPSNVPTISPTASPTKNASTISPTVSPTNVPTISPTASPTNVPTISPTASPTTVPTISPTASPTNVPTISPTASPTNVPTISPKKCPSGMKLLRVQVVTDANGALQNRFVVKKKNILGNFSSKVWGKDNFKNRATKIYQKCLSKDECYKLFMFDTRGDGMCCNFGKGGFKATWRNSVIIDTLSNLSFKDGDVKKVRFGDC